MTEVTHCALDDLGVLTLQGPDARRFLQGQVSVDVLALPVGGQAPAGLHTPQGRVIALLQVCVVADDLLQLVLPAELAAPVAAHLGRYVLRAKVSVQDRSDSLRVLGVWRNHTPGMQVVERAAPLPALSRTGADWRLARLQAGVPQVVTATSGHFVAQMLNLDLVGAVSFNKGCYTGQEVIARAHYRGRVKRRAQRFIATAAAPSPGSRWRLPDGRGIEVVNAEAAPAGCEVLAVAALVADGADAADLPLLDARAAPLPYSLAAD